MAGWRVAASSMSEKRPHTCGRIASRSKLPTSANTSAFSADTVKWFDQNQTRRSLKGSGVEAAAASRAATSSMHDRAELLAERSFDGARGGLETDPPRALRALPRLAIQRG